MGVANGLPGSAEPPAEKPKGDEGQLFVGIGVRPHQLTGKWEAALMVNGLSSREEATKMADALLEIAKEKIGARMQRTG